tara:strand:- start:299 stop:496 length:198 start_codon:yes stop_codon:yes gene_type:complete
MVFTKIRMANPNQKTILIEQALKDIKGICKKFQDDSGSTNAEVKTLLNEIANLWETQEKNKFGFR